MKMRPLLVTLFAFSLSWSAFAQEKAAAKSSAPAKKPAHAAASSGGWKDTDNRGEVLKVWKSNPLKGYAEIVLIRLSSEQLSRYEDDPVKFVNEPSWLFSKKVIGIAPDCMQQTKHHVAVNGQEKWLVTILHNNFSNQCGGALPELALVDEATAAARVQNMKKAPSSPKK